MTNVALIFPGQGSQSVGMGKEFYDSSPEAKDVFDQANELVEGGLLKIIFEGPPDMLTSTNYCQPAIVATSIAALRAFQAHEKYKAIQPTFTAGLSLGEYSALAASGALSFSKTINLVRRRSSLMEAAARLTPGKMAAIIGLDKARLEDICNLTGATIANHNSPQQIVITGEAAKVEEAARLCQEAGAKNVVMLDVSGAFHSSLMESAAEQFRMVLERTPLEDAQIPIVSNVDAHPVTNSQDIRLNLAHQITSSVQWVDSVQAIASAGVKDFIEIGPGKVLKGLIKRIDPSLKVHNIATPADIAALKIGTDVIY